MTTTRQKQIGKPLTPPKAFFEWCNRQIPTYEWKNKKKTILASMRKNAPIIKKRLTKKSRLDFPTKFYSFAIILVSKKRIEIQSHCYWQTIKDGRETLEYEPTNFERFTNSEHVTAHKYEGKWCEGLLRNYGYMSSAYTNTVFYPNNWQDQVSRKSELRYLDLPMIDRYQLATIYKYREEIEYLQKINAPIMANELIYQSCQEVNGDWKKAIDMRIVTKKWLRKHKAILKNTDKTFNAIMIAHLLNQHHLKMATGFEKIIDYRMIRKLPKQCLRIKFQKWAIKQKINSHFYLDYLHILEELQIPLDSEQVLMPDNLQESHDQAVETLNQLKREVDEKAYQKREKELHKLEKEIGEFVFIVPHSLQDIVNEGSALHHCVGGQHYLEQHKQGKTTILFVRKKEQQNEPYFTLEYHNKRIVQVQGRYNREEVPQEVEQAIEKWQRYANKIA